MCGICGFVGNKYSKEEKEVILKKMMDAMRHRGPDSDGVYATDDAGLGFVRLSIIDLADGAQPMYNEDKNLALVFNGEIYNYRSLKNDLLDKGHQFSNKSDSETLLSGIRQRRSYLQPEISLVLSHFIIQSWMAILYLHQRSSVC